MKKAIQFALIVGLLSGLYSCTFGLDPNSPKVLLPAGTLLKVSLVDPLRSNISLPGDTFLVSMTEPVVINGVTVLDSRTLIWGQVVDSVKSGRVKGSAGVRLRLTDITQSERTIPIITNAFTVGARVPGNDSAEAAPGGIRIVPYVRGKSKSPIGVLTNAAVDSGVILGNRDWEIYFGPETRLNFTLLRAVELSQL